MPSRTVYCDDHDALEDIASIDKIEKASDGAHIYSADTRDGCRVRFVSSLPWKKGPQ